MKLLRLGNVGQEIPAAIDKNGKYRDLSSHIKDFAPETINFENLEKLKKIDLENLEEIDQSIRIGPCITKPGNFFAIGLNYVEHAKETKAEPPKNPILFNKSIHCIVGPNDNVVIPKGSKKLDHEVEIALIIGKKAKSIKEKNAQDYIFGYCICNDISEREWQKEKGGQWVKGKSGDTFGPLGPYLVTKDEIEDIGNMNLTLDVNNTRRQTGNTNQMIFNFNFLVTHITSFITLMPGDIVTTGTPPGVGLGMTPPAFLKDGDRMELSVDSLGSQTIEVIAE